MTSVPYGAAAGAVAALVLGGAYLAGGLAGDASLHNQADRLAIAAAQSFSDDAVEQVASQGDASVLALGLRYETLGQASAEALKGPTATITVAPAIAALRGPAPDAFKAGPMNQTRELECLTEAVYYEARGETPAGQQAVAQVVLNRVHHPAFPKSVCGVVFQGAGGHGCQFSFACDGSLHQAKERGAWERARRIATRALNGQIFADVGQATHFHVSSVQPGWNMLRVAQIGTHVFYRFGRPVGQAGGGKPAEPKAELAIAAPGEPSPQVILASVTTPVPIKAEPQIVSVPQAKPEAAKAEPGKAEPQGAKPAL